MPDHSLPAQDKTWQGREKLCLQIFYQFFSLKNKQTTNKKNSLNEKKKKKKGNLVECNGSFQFVQRISQFSVKKK